MSNSGKVLTVFLIVIAILLLSLTAISLFFYQQESEKRKTAESELTQTKALQARLENELKDAKKQIYVLEEKSKESDEKINSLLDELEVEKGLREQMKQESASLRATLVSENQAKEKLQADLNTAQEKINSLQTELESQEKLRQELEVKAKESEEPEPEVELEKIVVAPDQIPEGKVLSVNHDNNFLIFNLGQESGIAQGMLMSVLRGDKYLGDIKVSRVQPKMSVGDFIEPLNSKKVKENDRVVVKE